MTKSTYHGATFVLAEDPGAERLAEIVNTIVEEHFPTEQCSFELSKVLPTGLPVDVADQLLAHQKDLGAPAVFLLVAPLSKAPVPNVKVPR